MIEDLEKSLANKDLMQASVILDKLYKDWNNLTNEDQARINDLESIYLTLVNAEIKSHKEKQKT